jgi:hypothetical protein
VMVRPMTAGAELRTALAEYSTKISLALFRPRTTLHIVVMCRFTNPGDIDLNSRLGHTASRSRIAASSFSGLLTLVDIGQVTIALPGNGRIRSAGSYSLSSH